MVREIPLPGASRLETLGLGACPVAGRLWRLPCEAVKRVAHVLRRSCFRPFGCGYAKPRLLAEAGAGRLLSVLDVVWDPWSGAGMAYSQRIGRCPGSRSMPVSRRATRRPGWACPAPSTLAPTTTLHMNCCRAAPEGETDVEGGVGGLAALPLRFRCSRLSDPGIAARVAATGGAWATSTSAGCTGPRWPRRFPAILLPPGQ